MEFIAATAQNGVYLMTLKNQKRGTMDRGIENDLVENNIFTIVNGSFLVPNYIDKF